MRFNRKNVKACLENFNLRQLFIQELGWNFDCNSLNVSIDGTTYLLEAFAHKRGMVAYYHVTNIDQQSPDPSTRQKIERAVAKIVHEHLIIYCVPNQGIQYWQWVKRVPGKSDQQRMHTYRRTQAGESLIQKLEHLYCSLDVEESLTIVDVVGNVVAAFDVNKITKKFYDEFKAEHDSFLNFVGGIDEQTDIEWYTSLMLNRMMFIYFIQKRGFLDDDIDYLQNRLQRTQGEHGHDKFHTFYQKFLLRLFHEGLGQPEADRLPELSDLLGQVPFLNGGLFDEHQLERENRNIYIPDEAFQRIFKFFDGYQWHLDDRPLCNDNEINPDVLGYIFEKYINQKQMGAYYTKEDITGYIARNSVIPNLFDSAKRNCPIAFESGNGVWRLLIDEPNRYFYSAVLHGIYYDAEEGGKAEQIRELPDNIAVGLSDATLRDQWDQYAPEEFGLPRETWRELIARRQRHHEIRNRIINGEVDSINDLVTYNLDIEKFVLDVIAGSEGTELIRAFWKAINEVSILDPTCGSGAFLFAALNILEPIYVACLDSMQRFLDDLEHSTRHHHSKTMNDLRQILADVASHASEQYFILKSIIVNNLYGVDIMEEAVEICKLRLFLKLVAQLDDYQHIEPLPDIDFNIRSGNTLVGFTSYDDVQRSLGEDLTMKSVVPAINARAATADDTFNRFRSMQIESGVDATSVAKAKLELREKLDDLRDELDVNLAVAGYGLGANEHESYANWRTSHLPFHWFIEFYGIMQVGGFDVIIGNPPYIARNKIGYRLYNFNTCSCPDIYAVVLERSFELIKISGRSGMILPLSLSFSSRFKEIRKLIFERFTQNWFSSYGNRPSMLFKGVDVRNTIHLGSNQKRSQWKNCSTRLHRWYGETRPNLFDNLTFVEFDPIPFQFLIPKLNSDILSSTIEGMLTRSTLNLGASFAPSKGSAYNLFYKQSVRNWLCFCKELPPCKDKYGKDLPHTKVGELYFKDESTRDLAFLFLNGKIMFTWWCTIGDDFDLTKSGISNFPIDFSKVMELKVDRLIELVVELENSMNQNVETQLNANRYVGTYNLARCRSVTDESDQIFLNILGAECLWNEIELMYAQIVKTDFSGDRTDSKNASKYDLRS